MLVLLECLEAVGSNAFFALCYVLWQRLLDATFFYRKRCFPFILWLQLNPHHQAFGGIASKKMQSL